MIPLAAAKEPVRKSPLVLGDKRCFLAGQTLAAKVRSAAMNRGSRP
jgi:hypothetical protein